MKIHSLFPLIVLITFTFAAVSLAAAKPDPRANELDWSANNIQVKTEDDKVKITLQAGGMAGRRLIHLQAESFSGDTFTTLSYQIIQNTDESFRHMESFDVTWVIPKDEFEKLRKERKFYILERDPVYLGHDEVKEIQTTWKIRPER